MLFCANKNGRVFRPSRSKLISIKQLSLLSPASARLLLRRGGGDLLRDGALEVQRAGREVGGARLQDEGVKAAIVVDALDGVGRDAQAHVAAERIRDEGDVAQVG